MSADPESDVFEKYMGTISEHGESIPVARTVIPDPAHPVQRYFLEDILHTLFSAYPSEDLIPWVSEPFTAQCISEEKNITTLSSPEGNGESNSPNSNTLLEQPAVRELPGAGKHQFVPVGLIAATIAHIAKNESDGVILAILPGLDLMKRLEQMLYGLPLGVEFKDENQFQILKLHAGFGDMNADVLRPVKKGCRKIILSTNVAETFINIPEVRYVVDSGKTHDSIYDFTTGRRELIRNWIDKPTFRQRQAYTGLTGNGSYYAMFTDARADTLAKSVTPKINNRRDIETECLLLSATIPGLHLHDFLRQLPDPPSLGRIDHTISSLTKRGVIDDSGNVTALGRILSVLPVDIMAGKIVMLGIILRCFEPALVLGAAMHAPPFFIPSGGNLLRRKFAFNSDSDQLAILKAYQTIRRLSNEEGKDAAQKFCSSHAISYPAYLAMEEFISGMVPTLRNFNLISESQANGQLHGGTLNENSKNQPLLSALIAGSVAPNIAIKTRDSGTIWRTRRFPMAIVSNKSPNAHKKCSKGRMLVFRDALKFTTYAPMTLVDTTMLHPLIACLLGGELLNRRDNTLLIDSFLPIKVELPNGSFERNSTAASMIVQARKLIDEAFTISYENLASNNLSEVDEVRHQTIVTQIADMVAAFSDMRRPQPPIRQNR
ncbi:hypothetical protein FQN49_006110 [Arthroderma sp. PD_2]|nr:hypothetical protein FQN49_006110 [Arthroderma sp. PD_2]